LWQKNWLIVAFALPDVLGDKDLLLLLPQDIEHVPSKIPPDA
jgi:hypothetical protein